MNNDTFYKKMFELHGNQMAVILEGIRQSHEKRSMKELDEQLAKEYPEFVSHGKPVTNSEPY